MTIPGTLKDALRQLTPLGIEGSLLPETTGGLFTSGLNTAAGLNKPRWARIIDMAGSAPVRYAWEEQTFQALAPGENVSIGFVKAEAGIVATTLLNPIIEPNRRALQVGDYVMVRQEYFDPVYDWVFTVIGTAGGASGINYAKCLNGVPDGGRFDARLQNFNADGTLADTGASIWLRDGNNAAALTADDVYLCGLTGSTLGRPVYTTCDFNLSIVDLFTGSIFTRVLNVYLDSTPTAYDSAWGDCVFSYAASTRTLTIRLNGNTESYDFLTRCVSGMLKKRTRDVRNGLEKTVSVETDA